MKAMFLLILLALCSWIVADAELSVAIVDGSVITGQFAGYSDGILKVLAGNRVYTISVNVVDSLKSEGTPISLTDLSTRQKAKYSPNSIREYISINEGTLGQVSNSFKASPKKGWAKTPFEKAGDSVGKAGIFAFSGCCLQGIGVAVALSAADDGKDAAITLGTGISIVGFGVFVIGMYQLIEAGAYLRDAAYQEKVKDVKE